MAVDPKITETCWAIRDAGFPILTETERGERLIIKRTDPRLIPYCEEILDKTVKFFAKKDPTTSPRIWTSPLIKTVSDFAEKHGLTVVMQSVDMPATLVTDGKSTIGLSLSGIVRFDESTLLSRLKHEHGHMEDQKILLKNFTQLAPYLATRKVPFEGKVEIVYAYLNLFEAKMSSKEKDKFRQLSRELLGNVTTLSDGELITLIAMLGEALRYGEEVKTPSFQNELAVLLAQKNHMLMHGRLDRNQTDTEYSQFKEFKGVDIAPTVVAAQLKEAGKWDELEKRGDLDRTQLEYLRTQPRYVEFFRMCIRAAKGYFPG